MVNRSIICKPVSIPACNGWTTESGTGKGLCCNPFGQCNHLFFGRCIAIGEQDDAEPLRRYSVKYVAEASAAARVVHHLLVAFVFLEVPPVAVMHGIVIGKVVVCKRLRNQVLRQYGAGI